MRDFAVGRYKKRHKQSSGKLLNNRTKFDKICSFRARFVIRQGVGFIKCNANSWEVFRRRVVFARCVRTELSNELEKRGFQFFDFGLNIVLYPL